MRDEDVPPLVARQYAGKEALLPILAELRKAMPKGAREEARRTYVVWTNGRQFALLQPTT
jgi:hypothetical protein